MTAKFLAGESVTGNLKIEYLCLTALTPYERNARAHPARQMALLEANIRANGFLVPVLIDAQAGIIAGHARLEAAKRLGFDQVPCIRIEHLSEAQKRAFIIADNRLAELAEWDKEKLAAEFEFLLDAELDFSVDLTGFETAEIDVMLDEAGAAVLPDPADRAPDPDLDKPAVSKLGDLWLLGPHRLLCGSALESSAYEALLGGELAGLVFTDPPYNVPIQGHVSGLGRARHAEFAMASGEMSSAEFTEFLKSTCSNLARHSADGSIHFICMDWRHAKELIAAGETAYSQLKNICVWAKTNGGMGSLYRSQHEFVFVWKVGTAAHINNVELGKNGRYRTNLWSCPGVNSFGAGRDDALAMHPTVKPMALIADAIRDCSKRGGIILDPFAGSGSTIIAAEKTGRRGAAIELDPRYVDVAIRRFRDLTGKDAIHGETGLSFTETARNRAREGLVQPTAQEAEPEACA